MSAAALAQFGNGRTLLSGSPAFMRVRAESCAD